MATKKENIKPIIKNKYSSLLKLSPELIISNPEAANIVGIASKKENSTIDFLLMPKDRPPKIVAADLDTPGIMAID